jgi:hypothetical protein
VPLDRKAISREYKSTPRPIGVGAIRNTGNGKLLLVAGRDINALLNRHRAQLRLGVHRNATLQQDWNAAGEGAFGFEVVDTLLPRETSDADPTDDLRALQELWLEKLAPFPPAGYNLGT